MPTLSNRETVVITVAEAKKEEVELEKDYVLSNVQVKQDEGDGKKYYFSGHWLSLDDFKDAVIQSLKRSGSTTKKKR